MKSKTRHGLIAAAAILVLYAGLSGTIVSLVESPAYTVVRSFEDVEVRDYPPMIVAEVEVSGERKEAINAGFRQIADYIFGNNSPARKISTTAPVTQQAGEKVAMTAPVSQQAAGGIWKVRFVMPYLVCVFIALSKNYATIDNQAGFSTAPSGTTPSLA